MKYFKYAGKENESQDVYSYYDIHVTRNTSKDGDGYSVFVKVEGDADAAVQKAVEEKLFEYEEDAVAIDNVSEMSLEEYLELTGNKN